MIPLSCLSAAVAGFVAEKEKRAGLISPVVLAQPVESYRLHFHTYCSTRQQRPKQTIPSKVWRSVIEDMAMHLKRPVTRRSVRCRKRSARL